MRERLVAIEAGKLAAEEILRVKRAGFSVEYKGYDDPVTAADRAANAIIVEMLRKEFPDDTIVAEESAIPEVRGRRCWFVDPLDGTKEFVDNVPQYCVMIGLAIDGRACVGAVVIPTTGTVLSASPEEGAFVDDAPLRYEPRSRLRIVTSRSHRSKRMNRIFGLLPNAEEVRCGSVGVKVAKVLLDEADAYVHPGKGPKLWDLCAPEAIVRAAGGTFTDANGDEVDYMRGPVLHGMGMIVARPETHAMLVETVRRTR
jgi:3'(2'), 5'-bisphosphate nucleotidase